MMAGNPIPSLRRRSAVARRHASSVSDALAAAPHLQATRVVRSHAGGLDLIGEIVDGEI
jgi:hypothetical protein